MSKYNDRYGIPGTEVENLRKRWHNHLLHSEFKSFDEFLLWSSQNGYKKGLELRRFDVRKPHGPENSFYYSKEAADLAEKMERERRKAERAANPVAICRECDEKCEESHGCKRWRDWFVQNWNQNISISPKLKTPAERRKVFCYEHPDMVREGITFG